MGEGSWAAPASDGEARGDPESTEGGAEGGEGGREVLGEILGLSGWLRA